MRFVTALNALETGHHTGHFNGRRYGVTIERPVGARITKLFAEELGGSDIVSFNLFKGADDRTDRAMLKPCEIATEKVIDFVLQFEPEQRGIANSTGDVMAMK